MISPSKLKREMERRGKVGIRELARRTGYAPITILRYLKGTRQPRADTVLAIAKALGCRAGDLIYFQQPGKRRRAKQSA